MGVKSIEMKINLLIGMEIDWTAQGAQFTAAIDLLIAVGYRPEAHLPRYHSISQSTIDCFIPATLLLNKLL